MGKSALQDAIETAIKDAIEQLDGEIDEKIERYLTKNLVGLIDRAVIQMLATPKGARKDQKRAPGHNHRGRCGAKCFENPESSSTGDDD